MGRGDVKQVTCGARIVSVGAYRPDRVVSNDEVCALVDSTDEWVRRRSGIESRRFAGRDENVVTMAVAAGRSALARAGIAPSRVDTVIVATMSHLEQTPAAAPQVADRLGSRAAAFDVNSACAGFCVALGTADALVRAGTAEYVLVIGADKMTDIIDPRDRSTAVLFGDGAGAVVVGPGEPGIRPVAWGSDGSGRDMIAHSAPWTALRDDPTAEWPTMRMAGQSVFRWATREAPATARTALKMAGMTVADLVAFIPHQANIRITEAIAKALELPDRVAVAQDVRTAGNTSAASIPLAMEQLLSTQDDLSGGQALLVGFGAGLTQAALVVELP
ncbi:MAG TPA: beta-ketoacyl-ACP synthase III [Pseudonocardiaceae bacterium]|nr:beta-ketoacyl-ACP synthase III [Pseudonocardiaceae bacterium]